MNWKTWFKNKRWKSLDADTVVSVFCGMVFVTVLVSGLIQGARAKSSSKFSIKSLMKISSGSGGGGGGSGGGPSQWQPVDPNQFCSHLSANRGCFCNNPSGYFVNGYMIATSSSPNQSTIKLVTGPFNATESVCMVAIDDPYGIPDIFYINGGELKLMKKYLPECANINNRIGLDCVPSQPPFAVAVPEPSPSSSVSPSPSPSFSPSPSPSTSPSPPPSPGSASSCTVGGGSCHTISYANTTHDVGPFFFLSEADTVDVSWDWTPYTCRVAWGMPSTFNATGLTFQSFDISGGGHLVFSKTFFGVPNGTGGTIDGFTVEVTIWDSLNGTGTYGYNATYPYYNATLIVYPGVASGDTHVTATYNGISSSNSGDHDSSCGSDAWVDYGVNIDYPTIIMTPISDEYHGGYASVNAIGGDADGLEIQPALNVTIITHPN